MLSHRLPPAAAQPKSIPHPAHREVVEKKGDAGRAFITYGGFHGHGHRKMDGL